MDGVQNQAPIFNSPYYYHNALTAESMMVYLTTRLGSLDDQIQGIFTSQQQSEEIRAAIGDIRELLNTLDESSEKETLLKGSEEVLNAVIAIIDTRIALVDPDLAKTMKTDLEREGHILEGSESQYRTQQLDNTREYFDNMARDLESTAEMNMISLQSLMSARQTAISLATNLLAKLQDASQKVVDNIR